MATKWHSTEYPGVRYREHPTRKHKRRPDRYFAIRYRRGDKRPEEGVGWMSNGWTAEKAHTLLSTLLRNIKKGRSPQSLAEMRLAEQRKREDDERQRLAVDVAGLKYKDLAALYIDWARDVEKKASWNTDDTYLKQHILPEIGDLVAATITRPHIEQVKKAIGSKLKPNGESYAPATVKQALAVCRRVFRWAADTPASPDDPELRLYSGDPPTKGVKPPKVDNQREAFFTQDQARLLFATLADPPAELLQRLKEKRLRIGQTIHDAALYSLWTGHRLETCVQARKRWINLDTGVIITPGKYMKASKRHYAYTEDTPLVAMLKRRMHGPSPLLFPSNRTGGVRDGSQISRVFVATVDWLGMNDGADEDVERLVFHSLRHTFASWHAMNGTDLLTLRDLMGHATLKQTERYAHLMPSRHRQAASDLGRAFAAGASS